MNDFLNTLFIFLDFFIAVCIALAVVILKRTERMDIFIWKLFWIGTLLGLTWELGFNLQMIFCGQPAAKFLKPLPVHFMFIVASHSIWDGGLFIAGILIVRSLPGSRHFFKFDYKEFIPLVFWGQVQELAVEMISASGGAWEWQVYWWNPRLFIFNGHNITLLPQIVWLAAVMIYYPIVLMVHHTDGKLT